MAKGKGSDAIHLMNVINLPLQLHHLKDRMKEVLNLVQIIEKKMDAVKVTKSKVNNKLKLLHTEC